MRSTDAPAPVDVSVVFAQFVLIGIAGLILLPSLLGGPARAASPGLQNLPALGWLVVSLAASAWLVVLAPSFVRLVADGVAAGRRRIVASAPPGTTTEAHNLARWLVAFGEILVIQATVRPALVIILTGGMSQENAEAVVAAITVVALLLVLIWVHRTARPLVETAARSTLDALLASTDSDATVLAAASPTATTLRASRLTGEAPTRPALPLETTIAATRLADPAGETRLASNEETLAEPDTTRLGGTETLGGGR